MDQWYLQAGGKEVGPFDLATMHRMVSTGAILPDSLVRLGDGKWTAAIAYPELGTVRFDRIPEPKTPAFRPMVILKGLSFFLGMFTVLPVLTIPQAITPRGWVIIPLIFLVFCVLIPFGRLPKRKPKAPRPTDEPQPRVDPNSADAKAARVREKTRRQKP